MRFGLDEARPSATLAGHWIWEWLLVLLRHASNRLGSSNNISGRPRASTAHSNNFYPLHVASQIPGCPPPFVLLTIRAHPRDVQTALDSTTKNLPAHQVATWTTGDVVSGPCSSAHNVTAGSSSSSSSTLCRRSMCLTALDSEHPPSMHTKNGLGKTPLELEAESEYGSTLPVSEQCVG